MKLLNSGRRGSLVVALACVAALVFVIQSEQSFWRASSALEKMAANEEFSVQTAELLKNLANAHAGQVEFLLTQESRHLEAFGQGLALSESTIRLLELKFEQDPQVLSVLLPMDSLLDARQQALAQVKQCAGKPCRSEAVKRLKQLADGAPMNKLWVSLAEMLRLEARRIGEQRRQIGKILAIGRVGLICLCAFSLLALLLYLQRSSKLTHQMQDSRRTLQDDRDQLKDEAAISTLMLTELTQHLLTAREDERGRLARNLHDELGALLTSAKLDAARIKSRLGSAAPEASERLAHLVNTLNASIALGRTIIEDLRPSTLSNLGLVATLEILVREFAEAKGLEAHCDLRPVELASSAEIVVFRVIQEAITNISKYAQAKKIWVQMGRDEDWIKVSVRDDGVGFDSEATPRSAYGLLGMRLRVEAEGGRLTVQSELGKGSLIQMLLPVDPHRR